MSSWACAGSVDGFEARGAVWRLYVTNPVISLEIERFFCAIFPPLSRKDKR